MVVVVVVLEVVVVGVVVDVVAVAKIGFFRECLYNFESC